MHYNKNQRLTGIKSPLDRN
uniref:Uncharacterized protein n=1 Tax=Anguilla anguilla TaxID=7936 RepID=A0A0E9W2Z2_ANGAN